MSVLKCRRCMIKLRDPLRLASAATVRCLSHGQRISSVHMPRGPRIAIIGAGVFGCSTAMWATRFHADVTVFEREHICSGSSGLSIGLLGTHYATREDIQLRKEGLDFVARLGDEVGFRRTGVLRLAMTRDDLDAYEASAALQRAAGVKTAETISCAQLNRLVPTMRTDDLAGAFWMPESGHVDGHLLCDAYWRRAAEGGAELRAGTTLLAADRHGSHWRLQTTEGAFDCDSVVNAAGPYAQEVGSLLGHAVPIVNQRHEVAIAKLPPRVALPLPHVAGYFAHADGVRGDGLYWRSEGSDRLLVGLHSGYDPTDPGERPDRFRRTVSDATIEVVAEKLLHRMPGLSDMGLTKGWAGLYPMTRDEQIVVGSWPDDPSLVDATGGGGVGIQTSLVVGRWAALCATGTRPTEEWAASFSPARPALYSA